MHPFKDPQVLHSSKIKNFWNTQIYPICIIQSCTKQAFN